MESFQQHGKPARESLPEARSEPAAELGPDPADLASAVGNRAFTDLVSQGAGIIPGGRIHPSVEQTIARTRGAGAALDPASQQRFSGGLGDSLADVRVHTDTTADTLSQAVSARAFTTGSDIYFAQGEHRPGSVEGDRLLAHELSHVVQQRGAPVSGPMSVTEPGDTHETDADASARELTD